MPKKKISKSQEEDMTENNEELSIPEENLLKPQETELEAPMPKSKKYTNFVIRQKESYAEEVRNIIRNELINYEKERQNLKLQRKQEEERLRVEKENRELLDTVRKLKEYGLNPQQVIQETKVIKEKNTTHKKCMFCNGSFVKGNLPRHMNVCMQNPDSKNFKFLKAKQELETIKEIAKQKKTVKQVEPEEYDEPEDEVEVKKPTISQKAKPSISYSKRQQNRNNQDEQNDIW